MKRNKRVSMRRELLHQIIPTLSWFFDRKAKQWHALSVLYWWVSGLSRDTCRMPVHRKPRSQQNCWNHPRIVLLEFFPCHDVIRSSDWLEFPRAVNHLIKSNHIVKAHLAQSRLLCLSEESLNRVEHSSIHAIRTVRPAYVSFLGLRFLVPLGGRPSLKLDY